MATFLERGLRGTKPSRHGHSSRATSSEVRRGHGLNDMPVEDPAATASSRAVARARRTGPTAVPAVDVLATSQ